MLDRNEGTDDRYASAHLWARHNIAKPVTVLHMCVRVSELLPCRGNSDKIAHAFKALDRLVAKC